MRAVLRHAAQRARRLPGYRGVAAVSGASLLAWDCCGRSSLRAEGPGAPEWRWREYGKPWLREVVPSGAGGSAATWNLDGPGCEKVFFVPGEFLIGVKLAVSGSGASQHALIKVEYGSSRHGPWFPVAEQSLPADGAGGTILWPDVGGHDYWRLSGEGCRGCRCSGVVFFTREWGLKLTEQPFGKLDGRSERWRGLPAPARMLAEEGALVLGNAPLLEQLYHESDLLGWGAEIPFPCFMTVWAKPQTPYDFATLVHRFARGPKAPILVKSGKSAEARAELQRHLKALLQPQWARHVAHLSDADEVVAELWRVKEERGRRTQSPPPTLAGVNRRLREAYDRLGVPPELRQDSYNCQFRCRDPLMLILTKEAFGTWAPNRVFEEIQGYDIFRTYAEFSCVDGVICDDDAVWLHRPLDFYRPSPDVANGDKRTAEFFELLERQRPYISALLREYEGRDPPLVPSGFREGLEKGFLAPTPTLPSER